MDAPWTWPVSVASALAKKRRALLTVTPCARAPASAREASGKQFVSAVAPARGPTERRSQAGVSGDGARLAAGAQAPPSRAGAGTEGRRAHLLLCVQGHVRREQLCGGQAPRVSMKGRGPPHWEKRCLL